MQTAAQQTSAVQTSAAATVAQQTSGAQTAAAVTTAAAQTSDAATAVAQTSEAATSSAATAAAQTSDAATAAQTSEAATVSAQQTSLAQTETAQPTATATALDTATPTVTATSTPATTSTATATPVAHLAITPPYGILGRPITLTLSGFAPNEPIQLAADSLPGLTATVTATLNGSLVLTTTMPPLTFGTRTISATGLLSTRLASTHVFILAHLYASTTGVAGGPAVLYGSGFGAHELVQAYGQRRDGPLLGHSTTSSYGLFVKANPLTITVPLSPTGRYAVVVVGQSSGAVVTQTLTITPYLTVGPSSVAAGAYVEAAGSGYGAGESVTFYGGCAAAPRTGAPALGHATADSRGVVNATLLKLPATLAAGTPYAMGGLGTAGSFAAATVAIGAAAGPAHPELAVPAGPRVAPRRLPAVHPTLFAPRSWVG